MGINEVPMYIMMCNFDASYQYEYECGIGPWQNEYNEISKDENCF